ncbi:MAG: rhomboid family intramembrane serine protease [Nitrososphaeria archaeon]
METSPRRPIWTYIFIAFCVVMFVLENLLPNIGYLAFWPTKAYDWPWIFVTSIFLHADIEHLLFNMVALFFFGYTLENMIGSRLFVIIFLVSGILGNFGYLLTSIIGLTNMLVPAVGASGAIYGIVGTIVVLTPFKKVFLYGFFPIPLIFVVIFWVLFDLLGLFSPSGIAHGAHLGGIIVGILFGSYIKRTKVIVRYYAI